MTNYKVLINILGFIAIAVGFPYPQYDDDYELPHRQHVREEPQHKQYENVKKPYAFDYGVRDEDSGAAYGHKEVSDGNAIKGSYTVALPDGRIQRVNYIADDINGFQAEVTYEGEATYPEQIEKNPKQSSKQYRSVPVQYQQPEPEHYVPEEHYQQQPSFKKPQIYYDEEVINNDSIYGPATY